MTDSMKNDFLTQQLRRQLERKQHELAANTFDMLDSRSTPQQQKAAAAAIRRNEKSIALLTSKLLCTHPATISQKRVITGRLYTLINCTYCKASVRHEA